MTKQKKCATLNFPPLDLSRICNPQNAQPQGDSYYHFDPDETPASYQWTCPSSPSPDSTSRLHLTSSERSNAQNSRTATMPPRGVGICTCSTSCCSNGCATMFQVSDFALSIYVSQSLLNPSSVSIQKWVDLINDSTGSNT
jgi:hypothetical protein